MTIVLRHADAASDIAACFALMQQLRPHLASEAAFVAQIARQQATGYRLLVAGETPVGLAGYRAMENTIYGKFIYVDDLVVAETGRRSGVGARLLDAVETEARALGCVRLVLDTGLANSFAQRFYFRWGMLAGGLHFGKALT